MKLFCHFHRRDYTRGMFEITTLLLSGGDEICFNDVVSFMCYLCPHAQKESEQVVVMYNVYWVLLFDVGIAQHTLKHTHIKHCHEKKS